MIRVCLFGNNAYGLDVFDWDDRPSESGWYSNLLLEDLLERIGQGDIVMYFDDNISAEDWCEENGYKYELVESNDNN